MHDTNIMSYIYIYGNSIVRKNYDLSQDYAIIILAITIIRLVIYN